jgi:hypothetical protein
MPEYKLHVESYKEDREIGSWWLGPFDSIAEIRRFLCKEENGFVEDVYDNIHKIRAKDIYRIE